METGQRPGRSAILRAGRDGEGERDEELHGHGEDGNDERKGGAPDVQEAPERGPDGRTDPLAETDGDGPSAADGHPGWSEPRKGHPVREGEERAAGAVLPQEDGAGQSGRTGAGEPPDDGSGADTARGSGHQSGAGPEERALAGTEGVAAPRTRADDDAADVPQSTVPELRAATRSLPGKGMFIIFRYFSFSSSHLGQLFMFSNNRIIMQHLY